jgi:hypothetical protein
MNDKYDTYGNIIGTKLDDIRKGDLVEYIDTKTIIVDKKPFKIKIPLQGVWDGEKVQFDDKEKTLVRSIHWLKLVPNCSKCGRKLLRKK